MLAEMRVTTILPWYGTNRTNADAPARLAGPVDWLGVPCVGGGCELAHFRARTVLAADLHEHLVNYLNVVADPALNRQLRSAVRRRPFAESTLRHAQRRCRDLEAARVPVVGSLFASGHRPAETPTPDVEWAADYFVTAWMGRSANAGTDDQFDGGLPVRWNAGGGDSVVRYSSAWRGLRAWNRALLRVPFVRLDFFEFTSRALKADASEGRRRAEGKKPERRCYYVDLPWPDKGATYCHKFDDAMQARAAAELARFAHTTVIVRYGDHPLIRRLYGGPAWHWHTLKGRNQGNNDVAEVLITNRPS